MIEQKVDVSNFQNLIRTIDMKADRQEIANFPQAQHLLEKGEMDKFIQLFKNQSFEMEKRIVNLEHESSGLTKNIDS